MHSGRPRGGSPRGAGVCLLARARTGHPMRGHGSAATRPLAAGAPAPHWGRADRPIPRRATCAPPGRGMPHVPQDSGPDPAGGAGVRGPHPGAAGPAPLDLGPHGPGPGGRFGPLGAWGLPRAVPGGLRRRPLRPLPPPAGPGRPPTTAALVAQAGGRPRRAPGRSVGPGPGQGLASAPHPPPAGAPRRRGPPTARPCARPAPARPPATGGSPGGAAGLKCRALSRGTSHATIRPQLHTGRGYPGPRPILPVGEGRGVGRVRDGCRRRRRSRLGAPTPCRGTGRPAANPKQPVPAK